MEFQTRSEQTGLKFFDTLTKALKHAEQDETVWKISFTVNDEYVRLVKCGDSFCLKSIEDEIKEDKPIGLVTMSDWDMESKVLLLKEMGYDTDGKIITKGGKPFLNRYTNDTIPVDNFAVLPSPDGIILIENEVFFFIEYSSDFPKLWERMSRGFNE